MLYDANFMGPSARVPAPLDLLSRLRKAVSMHVPAGLEDFIDRYLVELSKYGGQIHPSRSIAFALLNALRQSQVPGSRDFDPDVNKFLRDHHQAIIAAMTDDSAVQVRAASDFSELFHH